MKRRYETILLFDIDAGEETHVAFLNRSKALIEQFKGGLLDKDVWGVRKLAYEVRKKTRGFYVRLDYYSEKQIVEEFERVIRLEDSVMKYLTVLLDDNFDPEKYKQDQSKKLEKDEETETSMFDEDTPLNETAKDDDIEFDNNNDVEVSENQMSKPLEEDTIEESVESEENK